MQPYEDVLPFEDFSLRLDNADVPILKDILRNVSDAQYRHLLTGVLHHAPAFSWDQPTGGRAFHYTLLSLRRKYMNLKVRRVLLGGPGKWVACPQSLDTVLWRPAGWPLRSRDGGAAVTNRRACGARNP